MWLQAVQAGEGRALELPARGSVTLAFSPWDDPQAVILAAIGAARREIRVQAFTFTNRRIARALIEARQRGVDVAVLADAQMNKRGHGNVLNMLLDGGIPVALETGYAAAHNKLIIIDAMTPDCAVLTGSYNFTWSAQSRNAENLLLLRGNPPLARAYRENWQRHRAQASALGELPAHPR
jgi:phosphatidylserine/phosphatidylglycerophosphate/cardiolipin synthase-like enzyme